jgi:hypothetical protein
MLPKKQESRNLARDVREAEWNGRSIRYFAGQIIVKFNAPPPDSDKNAVSLSDEIARELPGGRVKRYPRLTGRAVFNFDATQDALEVAKRLSARPDVAYAEPDVVDSAQQLVPNDTRYGEQWSHGVVGSENAWAAETGAATFLI